MPSFPSFAPGHRGLRPWARLLSAGLLLVAALRAGDAYVVADYDDGSAYILRGNIGNAVGRAIPGMTSPWTFNRAMRWMHAAEIGASGSLAWSEGASIPLTGASRAAEWFAAGADTLSHSGDSLTCRKLETTRNWAHFALPPFQLHRAQHPALLVEVSAANQSWQLIVFPKGRGGPPLFEGEWRTGAGSETVDLASLYSLKGYTHPWAQIQVVLAVSTPSNAATGELTFRASLPTSAALVAGYPVIRSVDNASSARLLALPLDAAGAPLPAAGVAVTALVNGQAVAMSRLPSGVWSGQAPALPVGRHDAILSATWPGGSGVARQVFVITDGAATTYDESRRSMVRSGRHLGPQSGSYRAQPMFRSVGTADEALVQGQAAWDAVKGSTHRGQFGNWGGPLYTYHSWESLTDAELSADYAYLRDCGWDFVHLTQGWWIWDRWDAGGQLAPLAAEQLARSIAIAQHNNLRLYLALSHYPYGYAAEPPQAYLDAGYTGYQNKATSPQVSDLGSPFWTLYGAYLSQIATFLAEASPVGLVSASGEGDRTLPAIFLEQTRAVLDAAGVPGIRVTEDRDLSWPGALSGRRTYSVDRPANTLADIANWFDNNGGDRRFMVEGGFWGYSGGYTDTDNYRRIIRQLMYAGFVRRFPAMLTWEERVTEDEHRVLARARGLVDWAQTTWTSGNPASTDLLALPAGWRAQVSYSTDNRSALAFLTRTAVSAEAALTVTLANGSGTRLLTAWDLDTQATLVEDGACPAGTTLALPATAREVLLVIRPEPAPGANQAPTLTTPAAQILAINQASAAIAFTIADAETAPGLLTVTAASSDTVIVPAANIVLGGSGANRTVTITPATNRSGWTDIDLFVADGGATSTARFRVTVGSSSPSAVTLSASATQVPENGGSATLTVHLNPARAEPITVTLAPSGVATSGLDYLLGSTSLTIQPGQSSASTTLHTLDNSNWSGNRGAVFTLASVSGGGIAVVSGVQQVTLTILEDEPPPALVALSASPASFGEAGGSATVTATLNQLLAVPVVLTLSSEGTATPGADYTIGNGGVLTIPAGQLSASLALAALQDAVWEGSETIVLTPASITGAGTDLNQQLAFTLLDDEATPVAVNVDFGTASSALYTGLGPASGTGTIGAGTETWNRVSSASASNLLGVGGAASGVSLALANHTGFYDGGGSAGTALAVTRDYVYRTSATQPFTLTLSGLGSGTRYALWFIGTGGQYSGYGSKTTLDGVTRESSWNPPNSASWAEGQNFYAFASVAANASGQIVANFLPNSVQTSESDLAGLQLRAVSPAPAASPTGLVATAAATSIALSWTDVSDNETGFRVERAPSARGPFEVVHTAAANTGAWTDTGLASGATWHYRVRAFTAASDSLASATTSATTPNPLEQWRQTYWGTSANSGPAADTADPDGDGLANLLEYALGTHPLATSSAPAASLTASAPHALQLTFLRARSELTYEVLAGADLAAWSVIATNPGAVGELVTVTDTVSLASAPRRFLRLSVSR